MTTGVGIGSIIGDYTLESVLGRGGMSVVYVAEDAKLGRRVALKVMSEELSENEAFRTRFIRESKMAANLEHPSIVPVYDAGEADGVLYLAMRVIRGTDLRREITDAGPMEAERTMAIMRQMASALDTAHRAGLVHRDVKPGNVLLATGGEDEHAYLTDFGLTKHVSSKSGLTKTGTFMGTIDYVAPEQIRGTEVDGRTDLYSLACVMYECLTGDVPFVKDTDVAILFAHLEDERPRVTTKRPELPSAIDDVIGKAMAKDKEDRFPNCMAFVQAAREARVMAPSVGGSVPPAVLAPTIVTDPPGPAVGAPSESGDLEPHPSFPPVDDPSIAPAAAVAVSARIDIPPAATAPVSAPIADPSAADVPAPPDMVEPPPAPVVTPGPPTGRAERRRRTLLIVAIVAAIAVVGSVAAIALSGGGQPADEAAPSATPTQAPSPTEAPSPSAQVEVPPPVKAPVNPRATEVTSAAVTLVWAAAPNGSTAERFLIFRDGKQIAKVTKTTFVDRKVDPSTTLVYRIVAIGEDGSQARAEAVKVTTPAAPSTGGPTGGSTGGSDGCSVEDFLAGNC
jgi:tRNA A-37 threonylcarbamoyl transferase component Bud32